MMTKVKICGITNLEDALLSAKFGADALGFNFYKKSARYIEPFAAKEITGKLSSRILKVGVFVNEDLEKITEIANIANLDAIQLHGEETPEFAKKLKKNPGFEVIKAFRIGEGFEPENILRYEVDAILLDTYSPNGRGGTGETFDWEIAKRVREMFPKMYLAGGLSDGNVRRAINEINPAFIDVCSRVERKKGVKSANKLEKFFSAVGLSRIKFEPNENGYWGEYGGRFVPETLVAPLDNLTNAYFDARNDKSFRLELAQLLKNYCGRRTPLFFAERLSNQIGGAKIYLKREDLLHTGAHKINNALGQILLARRMGKNRIIAETGAGQHGVATATVCALFDCECVIYMGTEDMRRQALNVFRMELLGAEVRSVNTGSKTLKDAINEALRDWVTNVKATYYLLGSALGPHPYPLMVRDFQSVIGLEAREQILKREGRLPECLIACVGGGSNSIGLFHPFLKDYNVQMLGVEAGGSGNELGKHAARFNRTTGNKVGVLQGTKSYLLQDTNGQIATTHSVSAGLDYASIGPEHAYLHDTGRIEYVHATDKEAIEAFQILSRVEGIVPALESAHAIALAIKIAKTMSRKEIILVNLSGRGDKDVDTVADKLSKTEIING